MTSTSGADGGAEEEEEEEEFPEDAEMVRPQKKVRMHADGRVLLLRPLLRGRNSGRAERQMRVACRACRSINVSSATSAQRAAQFASSPLPLASGGPIIHDVRRALIRSHVSCTRITPGINFAHKRISELVAMLARYEAVNSNQKRALNSARVAADQFKKCLEDGKTHLSVCKLRDVDGNLIFAGSSKAIVPQPPIVQQNHSSVLRIAMASSSSSDRTTPRQPNMAAELEENSQGSQALLELAGASQISLTGLMASQEVDEPLINSQESAARRYTRTTRPRRKQTHPTRTCRRADRIGARRRPNGPRRRTAQAPEAGRLAGRTGVTLASDVWPPTGTVAGGRVPMPSATYASTYEPMGSQGR